MDNPIPFTVTKEELHKLLEIVRQRAPRLMNTGSIDEPYDNEVRDVNRGFDLGDVRGPSFIIDISDPYNMNPGHLASTLNGYGNHLEQIAEESKKSRELLEIALTTMNGHLEGIKNAVQFPNMQVSMDTPLSEIRDAIRSLADAAIISQPLPAGEPHLEQAAARIVEMLDRRPELREAVENRLLRRDP